MEVDAITRIIGDQRNLIISSIKDPLTRHVAYGVSYNFFLRNQEGSNSIGATYIFHKMKIKSEDFD